MPRWGGDERGALRWILIIKKNNTYIKKNKHIRVMQLCKPDAPDEPDDPKDGKNKYSFECLVYPVKSSMSGTTDFQSTVIFIE